MYHCQALGEHLLTTFLAAIEEQSHDGVVSIDVVKHIVSVMKDKQGPYAGVFAKTERDCLKEFALIQHDKHRVNYLGRLVVKTFSHLLDKPQGIPRKFIPQFFIVLKMILGEENHACLQGQCLDVINTIPKNDVIPWDAFYAHPSSMLILEQVQVSIARTFKRFDPRKAWFLTIMNSSPTSISTSSTSFVVKPNENKPHDKSGEYNDIHFVRMMMAIFNNVRPGTISADFEEQFRQRWNASPKQFFSNIIIELTRMECQ
jgi:hypothetical protein